MNRHQHKLLIQVKSILREQITLNIYIRCKRIVKTLVSINDQCCYTIKLDPLDCVHQKKKTAQFLSPSELPKPEVSNPAPGEPEPLSCYVQPQLNTQTSLDILETSRGCCWGQTL